MVCKKSLYCWKNGPCASDQTRKQIWEENIRFRESLRDINQSDHYWSFQISKNKCLCLEGEDLHCNRPLSQKYKSASLQRLHDIDCASITHDYNGLKFRNCFVHCPIHSFIKKSESKRADTPVPQSLGREENALSCLRFPFRPLNKSSEEGKSEYCHRYKNSLLKSNLKPCMKTKFLSQLNLSSLNETKNQIAKKLVHSSCEDLHNVKTGESNKKHVVATTEKVQNNSVDKKFECKLQNDNKINELKDKKSDCEVQTELVVPKKRNEFKPVIKLPCQENVNEFSPLSRTTRKTLTENKKIPFVTYGCNNSNLDIGSKRTHNVLASKLEVYPNALSAKQQKRDLIMKHIRNEKEFQKKCLPEGLKKRINHSSLWSLDTGKNESKSLQKKSSSKYLLPVMSKPLKKMSVASNQHDIGHYRIYRKPQIYFY